MSTRMQPSSGSLIDSIRGLITPDVMSKASAVFGESEGAVTRGFGAALPVLLSTLAGKANDTLLMNQAFNLIKDSSNDGSILNNPASLLGMSGSSMPGTSVGNRFMSMLFGDNTSTLANALSSFSGVKASTASSMLSFASPLVLAALGKIVSRDGLNATGLSNLLAAQRNTISSMLPAGLSNLLAAGLPNVRGTGSTAVQSAVHAVETVPPPAFPLRWLLVVLLGVLALWGLYTLFANSGRTATLTPATGDFVSSALPNNVQLRYQRNGVEAKLINFIEDPSQVAGRDIWFDFDRLLFESGSPVVKPESRDQLRNIGEILRAYPRVNIKIGGYTDSSGDPAANLKLSQDRAESVRRELINFGVAGDRLTAEGYGEQNPVTDNSTEAGRAQNRRVAMRVAKK